MTGALKELARLAPLEEDDKKLVQIVSRESQRLNQIITDFLDYSRGKILRTSRTVDVVAFVEETLTAAGTRRHRRRAKHRIERDFKVREAARARVTATPIKQVFWNLCNNALRAMPDGRRAYWYSLDADADWARISDSATRESALTPREATRIFEPFQSGFAGGTGLGSRNRVSDFAGAPRTNLALNASEGTGR